MTVVHGGQRLEQSEQREAERSGRVLGGCYGERREWASPMDWQWEEKVHGAAVACAVCGGQEAGGAHQSGSWCGQDVALAVGVGSRSERRPRVHAVERGRVGWASLSQCGLGPVSKGSWAGLSSRTGSVRCTMLFHLFKNCSNFVIHVWCLPEFQKCSNFVKWYIWTSWTTFLIGLTLESQRIASYNFWDKFKFEFSLNFKCVQTFLEKSNKFYKSPSSHGWLEDNFTLPHLYSNTGSSFTSGNRYLVNFRLNHLGNLRWLPQLPQDPKLDKECSQVIHKTCTTIRMTYTI
jgi:hypothetical protein